MAPRSIFLALCAFAFLIPISRAEQPVSDSATKADPARSLIEEALHMMESNELDGAAAKLDDAIKLNPRSTVAHVLRGTIYSAKTQWSQAEAEFITAELLAPSDTAIKFFLADVKFSEKQYDAARTRYSALQTGANRGDFAAYEVFLCDLLGDHETNAAKELAAFNQAASKPSYYFSNAAQNLFHKNVPEGKKWLDSAMRVFSPEQTGDYAQTLRNLGYLPLPTSEK